MKVKQIRLCLECHKEHDTCIENRMDGNFEIVDTCIDCLMGKCSFNFEEKQVTLEDIESMTYDEMQEELGKTVLGILKAEYGSVRNLAFAECKMYNADGEEVMCQCGKPAESAIMGQSSHIARCNDCMGYNESEYQLVFKPLSI
jgi:hypothetical protein